MSLDITALEVAVEEDLLPLTALLHQKGMPHRIYEAQGRQVVKVASPEAAGAVRELYAAWQRGDVTIEVNRSSRSSRSTAPSAPVLWRGAPVTLALIALSIAGFLILLLNAPLEWLSLFTFTPFSLENGQVFFGQFEQQYWRLVTPAFLHFGWLHIVFNCLWLWELGSRVERQMGALNMSGFFLVIALVSNSAQYLFGGPGIFGGMSGVVYGLLGFAWVGATLQPRWAFKPSPAIMLFMVGWLVVCLVGVVEVLGFGAVANAAHVGGLLAGATLGATFGLLSRAGAV
mgnify:FL=1